MIVLLLLFSFQTHAIAPQWRYQVLRSANFELIYREDQKQLAKRYIVAAEQAHELLMPIFKEGPSKTIVVLQDDTDLVNGLATFLPYPYIVVYPVLPTQLDSIDEYGDWALELMIHEYAHILNMHPRHGIYAPLKYLFGGIVRPNAILPRWYLEGLAVNLESRLTEHGRLRSPDTQAIARAFTLGDRFKFEDIATINEGSGQKYPYGSHPYLFGGWWWDEVHRTKGEEVIYTWNQNFSRRLPFLLNGPMREQMGLSASQILSRAIQSQSSIAKEQIGKIDASKPHAAEPALAEDGEQGAFAISPSGARLVYWLGQPEKQRGNTVWLLEREDLKLPFKNSKPTKLFKATHTTRVAWVNDEQFVFDQVDPYSPYTSYRDLYLFDLKTKSKTRLTEGARAQEPAVSPSGQMIAFVHNDAGRNRIMVLNLADRSQRTIVNGNLTQRLASPEFLTDSQVVLSGRTLNGEERIFLHDLTSKKTGVWNKQLKGAQTLRRTSRGLIATDTATGVRNAYLVTSNGAKAITNTRTTVQVADIDPHTNAVLINELTPKGQRLNVIPLANHTPARIPSSDIEKPIAPSTNKVRFEEQSYQPIAYLWPRYLIPFVFQVEEGLIFQGITSNNDPVGRNTYSLMGAYDTVTKEPSYGFDFINRSLPTSIGLGYSKAVSYLGASGLQIDSNNAFLALGTHWPFNSRRTQWALEGSYSEIDGLNNYKRLGPGLSFSYSNLNSPLNDRWGFHLEANHREYLAQDGYLAYGRSSAHLATTFDFSSGHRIYLQSRAALSPKMPFGAVLDLGDRNVGGNYVVNLANSNFLLRGYPSGTFVGRKVVNGNLEYILPATDITRGFGTFPLFLRELQLAAFYDFIAIDGGAYRTNPEPELYVRSKLGEFYTSTGLEARFHNTIAYHMPFTLTLGAYYGFNPDFAGGFTVFMGIGLGDLGPLASRSNKP